MELSKSKTNNTSKWIQKLHTNPETNKEVISNNNTNELTLSNQDMEEILKQNLSPNFGRQRITDVPRINRDRRLSLTYYSLPLTSYNHNNLYQQEYLNKQFYCYPKKNLQHKNDKEINKNEL